MCTDLQLVIGGEVVKSVAMLSVLGDLAIRSGFDWVEFDATSADAHIGVAAIPDSCVTKLDLMFVLDSSASIAAAGYASEQKFVASLIDFFDIGPDATQVGMISYSHTTRLDFDFKQWNSTASLQKAILSATYQYGTATNTHIAMNWASDQFESVSSGSRIGTEHVTKVCVILTDGVSGVDLPTIAAAANRLKQLDVNVFTIGLGADFKPTELRAIASEPVDAHFFKLDVVSEIESFASTMAVYACTEPAPIDPCDTITVDIEAGDMRYFQLKPACTSVVVTDDLVLEANAFSGTSASIFVSKTDKNPSPFNNDHELHVSDNDTQSVLLSSVAGGVLYVGVWASGCGNGIPNTATSAAIVKFTIRADLFSGEPNTFVVAREHQSSGLEVYNPPPPIFTANRSFSAKVQYSLQEDNSLDGGVTFPFAINATSGTIYTTAPLEFDAQQYWNVHINANVTDRLIESKCICGKHALLISVAPDSTSPTTTATSTPTTTAILLTSSTDSNGSCTSSRTVLAILLPLLLAAMAVIVVLLLKLRKNTQSAPVKADDTNYVNPAYNPPPAMKPIAVVDGERMLNDTSCQPYQPVEVGGHGVSVNRAYQPVEVGGRGVSVNQTYQPVEVASDAHVPLWLGDASDDQHV